MVFVNANTLSGKELKVVVMHLPPATMIFRDNVGNMTGFGGIVYAELEWISQRLNFSLALEESKENNYGSFINGSWNGIGGLIEREEVDLACAPFTATSSRNFMELAVYVLGDEFSILDKYPNPETSAYGIFMTFSYNVWIGLLLSILAIVSFIYLIVGLKRRYFLHELNINLGDAFMYILSTFTSQGGSLPTSGYRSLGLIVLICCLTAFVFVNIYSSCLTSYMSLTFQKPAIGSFQDLANDPRYQAVTIANSYPMRIFTQSESGAMKEVGKKIRRCGDECSLTIISRMINKVLEGHNVAILPTMSCDNAMLKTMSKNQCHLTIAQETMGFQHMYLGVPKNSTYVMELNLQSFWWHSFGLTLYWEKRLAPRAEQCRLDYNSRGGTVQISQLAPFKLEQFYFAFLVLFIGYILALLQFIRERLAYHRNVRRIIVI